MARNGKTEVISIAVSVILINVFFVPSLFAGIVYNTDNETDQPSKNLQDERAIMDVFNENNIINAKLAINARAAFAAIASADMPEVLYPEFDKQGHEEMTSIYANAQANQKAIEERFLMGKMLWENRQYDEALNCFLEAVSNSDNKEWYREIAELIGCVYPVEKIGLGSSRSIASFSPDGRWIVFTSKEDGDWEIYLYDYYEKRLQKVTDNTFSDTQPCFSPDSKHLAYASERDEGKAIYLLDLEQHKEERIVDFKAGRIDTLVFSPDGERISFVLWESNGSGIHVIDIETKGTIELRSKKTWNYHQEFSPDGSKIVFFGWNWSGPEKGLLAISDSDHDSLRELCEVQDAYSFADFSFDNKEVVVSSSSEGIYAISLDGQNRRQIGDSKQAVSPCFSPDGKRIAFISGKEIRIASLDGNVEEKCVLSSDLPITGIQYFPDGKRILFNLGVFPKLGIVNIDDGEFVLLSSDIPCGSRNMACQWVGSISSDGGKILYIDEELYICVIDNIEKSGFIARERLIKKLEDLLNQEKMVISRNERLFKDTNQRLEAFASKVSQDNLTEYMWALVDIGTRSETEECIKASNYLYEKLASWGLDVEYDEYKHPQKGDCELSNNVVATLPGKTNPELVYVICGHYDTVKGSPGAWDNASGVAVILETARILSKLESDVTIKFVCFSGHENLNMAGSRHFVERMKNEGVSIKGVIEVDCVGYLSRGTPAVFNSYTSIHLKNLLQSVARSYTNLRSYSGNYNGGDTQQFVSAFGDITASLTDYPLQSHPNHYHSPRDTIDVLNIPLVVEITRLNVAALTMIAICPDLFMKLQ